MIELILPELVVYWPYNHTIEMLIIQRGSSRLPIPSDLWDRFRNPQLEDSSYIITFIDTDDAMIRGLSLSKSTTSYNDKRA